MGELLGALVPLLILLLGIGVIVGFPFGALLKAVGKWGLILLAIGIIARMLPTILERLQKHPPQSLQELGIWLSCAFVVFLVLLRLIFGSGAVGRLFERLVASAIYDVLKGLVKALFFGYRRFVELLVRLLR